MKILIKHAICFVVQYVVLISKIFKIIKYMFDFTPVVCSMLLFTKVDKAANRCFNQKC